MQTRLMHGTESPRFLLGELSEKINIVAEELRKGNSEIVKEFFDFLCIDISKKESGKK